MLEEYRQIYMLLPYRWEALDRRLPVTAITLGGLALTLAHVAGPLQWLALVGTPLWLIWLTRSTVNHARSLEDGLRRIEDIEREIAATIHGWPLRFQSSHPSRGVHVGGRTGAGTIQGVIVLSALTLVGCASLVFVTPQSSPLVAPLYLLYTSIAFVAVASGRSVLDMYQSPLPESMRDK